jgi:hypothetical protein
MTAIVYRDGVMAADTAVWAEGVVSGAMRKIQRGADGTLVAGTGPSSCCQWFANFILSGEDKTTPQRDRLDLGDHFEGLVVRPDGTVEYWNGKLMVSIFDAPFHVIGAQTTFMMGALYAGATAEQTVRLVIAHTDGAAGDVQVERLEVVN